MVSAVSSASEKTAPPKPNILLILADDLGWTGLGCYGGDFYETPNIDRLARQGVRFDYAFANMKNCAPSRASIMSGQYVGRHPVLYVASYEQRWLKRFGNLRRFKLREAPGEKSLPKETLTLAETLKKAGYVTAMFGKWHLGRGNQHPSHRGFDVAIESHGRHFGFQTDPPYKHDPDQYLSDFLADHAVEFMRQAHQSGKPFFLYFADFLVHKPLQAKKKYLEYFSKKKPGRYHHSVVAAAMIKSLDDTVGRLLQTVDELGISNNTLVVFMSDNGGLAYPEDGARPNNTSNYPLRAQKGSEFDGGLRVPFICRWTGQIPADTLCHEVVTGVDLYPTFLKLAGAPKPPQVLDGVDIMPILKHPSQKLPQRDVYWYMPSYSSFHRPCIVVRRGKWKLIHLFETGDNELYNTERDIGEQHNVAGQYPELVKELQASARQWMDTANVPRMKPNPEYDPSWRLSRAKKQKKRANGSALPLRKKDRSK